MQMIPGSWVELDSYDPKLVIQLFRQPHVEQVLLFETNEDCPLHPFMLLIKNPEDILVSRWSEADHFKGFILRTSKGLNTDLSFIKQPFWVEYQVNSIKNAERDLQSFSHPIISGVFLTFSQKESSYKLHKLLNKISNISDLKIITTRPYDIPNEEFNQWASLENYDPPKWENTPFNFLPKLSVVIPHFESPHFLCNVLSHLDRAFEKSQDLEVLVMDDSSCKKTFDYILYYAKRHLKHLPLKIFQWNSVYKFKNGEKVFRAGASRNWGAGQALGSNLLFLDADMLVPTHISELVQTSLEQADVIQFVRKHIPESLSSETTSYENTQTSPALYVEESKYWNTFFQCDEWESLPDYWKYTCTYGLAIKTSTFFKIGRLRRNFIRYGFEDTDLGYRLWKNGHRFKLNKTPFFHLSHIKDKSQSHFYRMNKLIRLKPMAKDFYRLNLDPNLYYNFQLLLD